jgi:Uma2 family endonuclease
MSAVFTPTRHKLSVDDYHKLGEAGILDEDSRVELIEGELIDMAPIGPPHMMAVNRLNRLLVRAVGDLGIVSIQNPITLPPHSEPQPDIAVLRPGIDKRGAGLPGPADVLLLIEVADTTLAYDRGTKLQLYAASWSAGW